MAASRDGGGNLLLPSAIYQYGILQAAGIVPAVATITATLAAGAQNALMIGRVDAAGANGAYVVLTSFATILIGRVNNQETKITLPTAVSISGNSSVGVRMASDGSWHLQVNGTDVPGGSYTPNAVATGYVSIGSSDPVSPQVEISGITVQ